MHTRTVCSPLLQCHGSYTGLGMHHNYISPMRLEEQAAYGPSVHADWHKPLAHSPAKHHLLRKLKGLGARLEGSYGMDTAEVGK